MDATAIFMDRCFWRKKVRRRRRDVLPSSCAIHETFYTIQVLSLHALSCISVSFPSVTRTELNVPSAMAKPQVFLIPEKAASEKRLDAVLGKVYLHSWCLTVARHGGKARPLRRVVADENSLFQKRFFQGLTDWDLLDKHLILYVTFPFLRSYQVLGWHHCHQVITSCSARQSRPLPFVPRGCTFSMVTTIACCPCHLVRVTSTVAVGRVAQIAKRWLPKLLCYSTKHCGFLPKANGLLFALSCCLAHALSAPRFPSFRPDTASFRSCLLLPPGFLGTREAGICAGSRAWSSSSFSSIGSARDGICPVVSSSQWEISLQALLSFEGVAIT